MSNFIDLTAMDTDSDDDKVIIIDHKVATNTKKSKEEWNSTMSFSALVGSSKSSSSLRGSAISSKLQENTLPSSTLSSLLRSLSTTGPMVEATKSQYGLAVAIANVQQQLINLARNLLRVRDTYLPSDWVDLDFLESEADFRGVVEAAGVLITSIEDAANPADSAGRVFAAQRSLFYFLLRLKGLPEEIWPDLAPPVVWDARRQSANQTSNTNLSSTIDKKISELGTKPTHRPSSKMTNYEARDLHLRRTVNQSPSTEIMPPSRQQGPSSHWHRYEPPLHRDSEPPMKKTRTDMFQTDITSGPLNSAPGTIPQPKNWDTSNPFGGKTNADSPSNYINVDDDDGLSDYRSEAESYDSTKDYDRMHSGYDIQDDSRWRVPIPPVDDDDVIVDEILLDNRSSDTFDREQKRLREIRFTRGEKLVRPVGGQYIWDLIAQIQQRVSAGRSQQKPSKLKTDPEYGRRRYVKDAMNKEASFKIAPGAINRIEQHSGWLAIGAARAGGQADNPDEPQDPDPYNDLGSLLTWDGQCHILPGHTHAQPAGRRNENGDEVCLDKCYTVNDIKFNNSGSCFVSIGMDKRAKFWTKGEEGYSEDSTLGNDLDVYDGVPYEIAFQPSNGESNVVAVGAKCVYVYPDVSHDAHRTKTTLILASKARPNHNTGAMRWDPDKPHILYASSEPGDDAFDGIHKAFDLNEGRRSGFTFHVDEAGDAMAVSLGVLALATRGERRNSLRLFDIKRLSQYCTQEIELEPSPEGASDLEVSCMNFSPDGICLALARSDNCVHVYDSRMLGRGVLHNYRHENQDPLFNPPGTTLYGVSHTQWITTHTGQFALLSGGNDGCVRLWNPTWSAKEPTNGRKIIEVNRDIGVFSVGDPFKGEHDLVVGDSSGEVTVFTGLLNYL